ncbi:MAG: lipid-A-disaccharide synthase [Gemmatimonadota bacterium]
MREVLVVAGEASGDLHGAAFSEALARLRPDIRMIGLGGRQMQAAGVHLLEESAGMSVMGFVEVLRQIPHHYRLLGAIGERLRSGTVGLAVLIDYPGFNMKVAEAARRAGIPVLYYITPQVWAWGAARLRKLAHLVTRAAVILPFEEELLRAHGIDATFVGHPLLDRAVSLPDRAVARKRLGLPADAPVLALFPGSRVQEIERHLDVFVAVGKLMQKSNPSMQVVAGLAPNVEIDRSRCPFPLASAGSGNNETASGSFDLLCAADVALCKSGTTTLEAAVAGCPLAIAYRTSGWTYAIARRVVRIPHIGLVNVVAGREIVREFVQNELRAEVVAGHLHFLLHDREARTTMMASLREVRDRLGTPGAAARVAAIASGLLR